MINECFSRNPKASGNWPRKTKVQLEDLDWDEMCESLGSALCQGLRVVLNEPQSFIADTALG